MNLLPKNYQEQIDSAVLEGAQLIDLSKLSYDELKFLYGNKLHSVLIACGITLSPFLLAACPAPTDPNVLPSAQNMPEVREAKSNLAYKFTGMSETLPGAQCSTNYFNVYSSDRQTYLNDEEIYMTRNDLEAGAFYGFDTLYQYICNKLAY